MLGRRGPSELASSRATIYSVDDLSLLAGPLAAAPNNINRSISPGCEAMDASPAALPPMLPPITGTLLAQLSRRYRTAAATSHWSRASTQSESSAPFHVLCAL